MCDSYFGQWVRSRAPLRGQYAQRGACLVPLNATEVRGIHHRDVLCAKNMSDDRALILIDCQLGFNNPYWGKRNNPDFEANAQAVLAHWRARGRKIIHVRHASLEENSPLRAEEPGFAFFEWAEPLELSLIHI